MLKKLLTILLIIPYFSLYSQIGTPDYDNYIKKQLDILDVKYSITNKGNFKLILELEDGRTQMVFITSTTQNYKGISVREIYSVAQVTEYKYQFSHNTLFSLLKENSEYKIGNWQIDFGKNIYVLNFSVKLNEKASVETLSKIIKLIAIVADRKEKELTNKDNY